MPRKPITLAAGPRKTIKVSTKNVGLNALAMTRDRLAAKLLPCVVVHQTDSKLGRTICVQCYGVEVKGPSRVVQNDWASEHGARIWIETTAEVVCQREALPAPPPEPPNPPGYELSV